jgi:AraC-like DNA-binding protein
MIHAAAVRGDGGAVYAQTRLIWSAELTDLDQLAAAQADARMEHVRTEPGDFRMRLRVADFGPLRLQSNVATNGYIARGTLRADRHVLFLPTDARSGLSRLNGFAPEADDLVLARPGAEVQAHLRPGQGWAGLLLHGETYGALLDGWPTGAGTALYPGRQRASPGLRRLALDVGELVATDPARLMGAAVAGALTEAFSARLVAVLGAEPGAPGRATGRYMRAATAAVDYLEGALSRTVYSDEVGRTLGVSPRFLNEAFAAVYGMSLHRYLRLRRLDLARRRLREAGGRALVKTVALDLGFWHLGRFAQAYRELFGETPSETLQRGRA